MFRKKWMVMATSVMLALSLPISNLTVSAEAFSDGKAASVEFVDFAEESNVDLVEEELIESTEFAGDTDISEEMETSDVMAETEVFEDVTDVFGAGEELLFLEEEGMITSSEELIVKEPGSYEYGVGGGEVKKVTFIPPVVGKYEICVSYDAMDEWFTCPEGKLYKGSKLIRTIADESVILELEEGEEYTLELYFTNTMEEMGEGNWNVGGVVYLDIYKEDDSICDTFEVESTNVIKGEAINGAGFAILNPKASTLESGVELSYKWYKLDTSTGKYNKISGAAEEEYRVEDVKNEKYYCAVSDNEGNTIKVYFTLVPKDWYINIDEGWVDASQTGFTEKQMNVAADIGSSVTLKVPMKKTDGYDMKYVWDIDGKEYVTSKPEYTISSVKGHMHCSMTAKDEGKNKQVCNVWVNGLGIDESKTKMRNTIYASSGQRVTLTAHLDPMLLDNVRYRWINPDISGSNTLRDTGVISGSNHKDSYTFTMGNTTRSFDCMIRSECGDSIHSLWITYEVVPAVTYQISYNANGGSGAPAAQYKVSGQTLTLSSTKPTRKGYKFLGWATSSNATSAAYKAGGSYKANGKATLYAVWEANTYKIAYYKNGGSGSMKETTVTYGKSKTLRSNSFTKKGYTFAGWNTKRDGSGTTYKNKASVKNLTSTNGKKISLYAQWKANSYKIAYYKNGGKGSMSESKATYDTKKTLRTNSFTRKGYTFAGWNTKRDGSGTSYTDKQKVKNLTSTKNKKVSLYAQWTPNTYRVAYYKNGGSGSMSEVIMTYDKSEALQANSFTKEGYIFTGWNTKRDGSGKTYTDQQEVKNLTSTNGKKVSLYAMWEKAPEAEIM